MKEKLKILDSLEVLSFKNQKQSYPKHYHETYCISLIQKGLFGENELIAPEGSIVISHPNEVHFNKLVQSTAVSFSTFYISEDIMSYISCHDQSSFQNKVIEDPQLSNQLKSLVQFVDSKRAKKDFNTEFHNAFVKFISNLTSKHGQNSKKYSQEPDAHFQTIKQHILRNLDSKINLTGLAKIVDMSKFQFVRWFKIHAGITPFEYILIMRVLKGKRLIQDGIPLVDASINSGFYDQSHFSNYFKKYIGMSPNAYRHACNIFQDN